MVDLPPAPMLTVADFRRQFPADFPVATHPDDLIESRLSEALMMHAIRPLATLYACAHLLALDTEHTGAPDAGAGVVSGERIGPRQVTYQTMASKDAKNKGGTFWATTSYGRRYLALVRTSPRARIGAPVAM